MGTVNIVLMSLYLALKWKMVTLTWTELVILKIVIIRINSNSIKLERGKGYVRYSWWSYFSHEMWNG